MKTHIFLAAFAATVCGSTASGNSLLERGEYLVEGPAGCGKCHTAPEPGSPAYGGWTIHEVAFTAEAPNITPASRIADWSDAELSRAIREGIRPDGSVIGPPMPIGLYRGLSDTDLAAIVAYIRTLEPVETEFRRSDYPFPLPPNYGPPVEHVPDIPRGETVEYGAYLAGPVAHCIECHSLTHEGPDFETNLGGGGYEFEGPWGVSIAANITSHPEALAQYSDDEVFQMVTTGVRPGGTQMNPPMGYAYYARTAPEDIRAIIKYLRTLPPIAPGG